MLCLFEDFDRLFVIYYSLKQTDLRDMDSIFGWCPSQISFFFCFCFFVSFNINECLQSRQHQNWYNLISGYLRALTTLPRVD